MSQPELELEQVRTELAPGGVLKVGLNMANPLLVKPNTPAGVFQGIVPDLARVLADGLRVSVEFIPYPSPGPLGDAAGQGACAVAFLADEPARARTVAFTPAYLEIVASYLVPPGSPLQRVEEVDRAGVRISVVRNSAYDLFLRRQLQHAQRVEAGTVDESFRQFVEQGLDALAGLQPRLLIDQKMLPGSTILPDGFTRIQQAIGTALGNAAGAAFLRRFVQQVKATGIVQEAIDANAVKGVNVAPLAA